MINAAITHPQYGIIANGSQALAGNGVSRDHPIRPVGGDDLNHTEDLQKEIENLRERLSRLSQASLRIAGDLDPDAVLQETVDGARALTGARYGVLAVLNDAGRVESLLASGLTPDEFQELQEIPGGAGIFEYLGSLPEPLRVAD